MDIIIPKNMYMNYNYDGLLWKLSKIQSEDAVKFNLQNVTFIRPEAIILLIVLSNIVYKKTHRPIEWINIDSKVHPYLDRMDISKLEIIKTPPIRKQFQWNRSDKGSTNLTELHIISNSKDLEHVMKRTKEMLIKWFPDKVGQDYCRLLPTLIAEIAGNSLEHSENKTTGICYFVAQKFQSTAETNIVVSFGDTGIGIRKSLKKVNEWLANDDLYSLKKAFHEGASCRADRSGGLGFQQVKSVLHRYGGEITLRSGMAAIKYSSKTETRQSEIRFRKPLPGTQVAFIL